jgi:uncharacterized membrane protein YhiD involved in acid resistance
MTEIPWDGVITVLGAAPLREVASDALEWGPIPDMMRQLARLGAAAVSLPLAAVLGAVLAFRPHRRGAPARDPTVIQAQILLAVVGALIMLVVGQSLARAFGIVGAASLIRYRVKVRDARDAGVMLVTLGIGLAAGVGLYLLAGFATAFAVGVLWWAESIEPEARKTFHLHVRTADPSALTPRLQKVLRRSKARFELRSASADEICYEVDLPLSTSTDSISAAILAMAEDEKTAVEWDERKAR